MEYTLLQQILPRLMHDYGFKRSADGKFLQQGRCPNCRKKELYTSADNPWVLHCGRENKCGSDYSVRDLYPEYFEQFTERFPKTPESPTAAADAYLRDARGLNILKMRGYYTQETWYSPAIKKGTATVRFMITEGNGSYMERFVDTLYLPDEQGNLKPRKQNFNGPHAGLWWQPPDMTIEKEDTLWLVEGIIDAISLWQHGIKAVAILSCGNYPQQMISIYQHYNVHWVWALDNDRAGCQAIQKHVKRMQKEGLKASAAITSLNQRDKRDWNDLHRAQKLLSNDIEHYQYLGALLIAPSALDKAMLLYARSRQNELMLDFGNQLYWYTVDPKDLNESLNNLKDQISECNAFEAAMITVRDAGKLRLIANVRPEFLYFERDEVRDETQYYVRVHFPDGRAPINLAFTNSQIYTSSEFGKNLVKAHGAWWLGEQKHLNWIGSRELQGLKAVKRIDYLGYVKDHDAYLFPNVAIQAGQVIPLNDEDFFALPKISLKSSFVAKQCTISIDPQDYLHHWSELVWRGFGAKGLVAAVFWFGALFAEQIRDAQSSYPFLEIIGEPGAGKTTLIEFLWRLFGRDDEEGFDPNKWSSVGSWRKLAQWSGMPTVFIEADRDDYAHGKKFDWENIKPFYNGRGLRGTGQRTNDNNTQEADFRTALVIAQNNPVNASDAVLERIVQLTFTKAGHTFDSRAATDEMTKLDSSQLSYFTVIACQQAGKIVNYVNQHTRRYQDQLLADEQIKHARLAKNHGQLMALADEFVRILNLPPHVLAAMHAELTTLCRERQVALSADHPIVAEFWDLFDYLDAQGSNDQGRQKPLLNHSHQPNIIAVNLNEFIEQANLHKQQVPLIADLKNYLKTSKTRPFIEASRNIKSATQLRNGSAKVVRCWIFSRGKHHD